MQMNLHVRKWFVIGIILLFIGMSIIPAIAQDKEKITISFIQQRDGTVEQSLHDNPNKTQLQPHVVVALIDNAIDIYHPIFRRENLIYPPSTYIEGFPDTATAVNITFDDVGGYWSSIEKDSRIWERLTTKTLYWFPHTNIIGITFRDFRGSNESPLLPGPWHGTATSSIIAMKCPNATIVFIQANSSSLVEAFSWAVNQSWIDIILPEFATRNNTPRTEWNEIPNISKNAVEKGKIIITPAGNSARKISFFSNICGMPWVISVGGVESYSHGASIFVSRNADYVSNYTEMAAHVPKPPNEWNLFNETYRNCSGTSASSVVVVATFASIVFKLREKFNYTHGIINGSLIDIPEKSIKVTNADVRDAVNHTALYWKTSDWSPGHWPYWKDPMWKNLFSHPISWLFFPIFLEMRFYTITRPINSFVPWLQMGWGFVDNSIVNTTVKILIGEQEIPKKPNGAVQYMNFLIHLRTKIWT